MNRNKGKFIVLYGINNLGKTTQAEMLVDRLNSIGQKTEYLKYPIYNLSPTGKLLNDYLREGNPYNLSAREAQIIYTNNRIQYEKELIEKLNSGINIVAEDYTGTGIAWGISSGVNEEFLKFINSKLLKEDISLLLDGERFREAEEANHKHESNNDLINKVRQVHLNLAEEYGWIKINGNDTIDHIHNELWRYVSRLFSSGSTIHYAPDFKNLHENHTPPPLLEKQNELIVERISPIAKLPHKSLDGDAAFELYSTDNYTLFPGDVTGVQTGIKMQIPDGHVGLIWDKSGYAKQGIRVFGGVIDSNYRGEITVLLKNTGNDIFNIVKKQKIAQIIIQKYHSFNIIEGEVDNETDRGDGGFGSTGLF